MEKAAFLAKTLLFLRQYSKIDTWYDGKTKDSLANYLRNYEADKK